MASVRLAIDSLRRLQDANFCYFEKPLIHYDRVLDVHDLLYLVEGEWEIMEEGTPYRMHPGDVLFLGAGRHHYGRIPCAPRTRTLYLHWYPIKGDLVSDSMSPHVAQGHVFFPSLVRATGEYPIRATFERIIRLFWSPYALNRTLARSLCGELSIELARRGLNRANPVLDCIGRCVDLIESHPDRTFSVDELAAVGGMSRRTFTQCFRRITGTSPHQYQLSLKIRMACSLLTSAPHTTIRAAAATFGFSDEFHFSKAFKVMTGMPPQVYREKQAHIVRLPRP